MILGLLKKRLRLLHVAAFERRDRLQVFRRVGVFLKRWTERVFTWGPQPKSEELLELFSF